MRTTERTREKWNVESVLFARVKESFLRTDSFASDPSSYRWSMRIWSLCNTSVILSHSNSSRCTDQFELAVKKNLNSGPELVTNLRTHSTNCFLSLIFDLTHQRSFQMQQLWIAKHLERNTVFCQRRPRWGPEPATSTSRGWCFVCPGLWICSAGLSQLCTSWPNIHCWHNRSPTGRLTVTSSPSDKLIHHSEKKIT